VHAYAGALRALSEKRILNGDQFRSVAAFQQAPQKEQRLMLSSTIVAAEVDE
jgi:hypothetical protein